MPNLPQPLTLIVGLLLIATLYVMVPLVNEALRRWRGPKLVTCPKSEQTAIVRVKPWRAAFTAPFVRPSLRIDDCSFWPECRTCGQECRKSIEA